MRHYKHTSHLTQECWLKLLVGKTELEALRLEHGERLKAHIDEMYRAYIARTEAVISNYGDMAMP